MSCQSAPGPKHVWSYLQLTGSLLLLEYCYIAMYIPHSMG
ncbi:unnamed protein product, partial [Staurois parvus]